MFLPSIPLPTPPSRASNLPPRANTSRPASTTNQPGLARTAAGVDDQPRHPPTPHACPDQVWPFRFRRPSRRFGRRTADSPRCVAVAVLEQHSTGGADEDRSSSICAGAPAACIVSQIPELIPSPPRQASNRKVSSCSMPLFSVTPRRRSIEAQRLSERAPRPAYLSSTYCWWSPAYAAIAAARRSDHLPASSSSRWSTGGCVGGMYGLWIGAAARLLQLRDSRCAVGGVTESVLVDSPIAAMVFDSGNCIHHFNGTLLVACSVPLCCAGKEYSKGDSRYVATIANEGYTVLLEGPASLLAVSTLAHSPSWHSLLLLLLLELIAAVLTPLQSFLVFGAGHGVLRSSRRRTSPKTIWVEKRFFAELPEAKPRSPRLRPWRCGGRMPSTAPGQ